MASQEKMRYLLFHRIRDTTIGSVQNDIPGPDVTDFFARIGISVPLRNRFLMCFDTKWLTRGWHTLRVVAKTDSGGTFEVGQITFRALE
jgi:hypothetical protein